MPYAQWRAAYGTAAAGDGGHRLLARLWNLENESRIPEAMRQFLAALGQRHLSAPDNAASTLAAFVAQQLRPVDSPWLGTLPRQAAPPRPLVTHRHPDAAAYAHPGTNPGSSTRRPSRQVQFPFGRDRRFVWVTFADDRGQQVSGTDPTAVVRQLGLAHYPEGSFVYRIELPDRDGPAFVPTALDAGLHEAWAPPRDPGADRGSTRDLVDGAPRWPELVVEAADYAGSWTGDLVSPPGAPRAVGAIAPDFMAGR